MISNLLESLTSTKVRIALVCTGAGAGIQGHLWNIPGISSVLVESAFPYAPEATDEYLGFTPESYASVETAVDLATEAYYRAYKPGGAPAIGIGLTASVASTYAHKGEHRAFAAYLRDDACMLSSIILKKGQGKEQRILDGEACDIFVANVILEATGHLWGNLKFKPNTVQYIDHVEGTQLAKKRFFKRPYFSAEGKRLEDLPPGDDYLNHGAIFPGAFDPPHEGHFGIENSFVNFTGGPVAFAIEEDCPHKGKLSLATLVQRAKMLSGKNRLFTSGLPLYLDKARRYPGVGIIIGADALIRMLDCKWGPTLDDLVTGFRETNTTFYVAGRVLGNHGDTFLGKLVTLEDVRNPGLSCIPLRGQWDISSSEIRARTTG